MLLGVLLGAGVLFRPASLEGVEAAGVDPLFVAIATVAAVDAPYGILTLAPVKSVAAVKDVAAMRAFAALAAARGV